MTATALEPLRAVIRLRRRTSLLLLIVSALGLAAFFWPFFIHAHGSENLAHSSDAPWLFVLVLPLLFAILLAELADGGLDSKAIAVLGVLTALGTAMRLPGSGVTGFTPVFFLMIPAGRVFGKGFGFVLGALTMFTSGLLTGGVGPWLPYQMFGAGWIGFLAGCLPPAKGKVEIWLLAAYSAISGLLYGFILNLWFWPFAYRSNGANGGNINFQYGAPLMTNIRHYLVFDATTSLGFDIPRAISTLALMLVAGRPVLGALRRAARRANFAAAPVFVPAAGTDANAT